MKKQIFVGSMALLVLLTACNNGKDQKTATDSTKPAEAKLGPGSAIKYDSSKRYVFLTWDDSPQPPGTVNSKAIFREQGIKATFFCSWL